MIQVDAGSAGQGFQGAVAVYYTDGRLLKGWPIAFKGDEVNAKIESGSRRRWRFVFSAASAQAKRRGDNGEEHDRKSVLGCDIHFVLPECNESELRGA